MKKVNILEKFNKIEEHWDPHIIAELNGQEVKIAKVKGAFDWHHHEDEDELFYVLEGQLKIEFRDHTETLNPGEMLVVHKGVEHRPVAENETKILLFEPASTLNTGNVVTSKTRNNLKKI